MLVRFVALVFLIFHFYLLVYPPTWRSLLQGIVKSPLFSMWLEYKVYICNKVTLETLRVPS